jgi:dimethylargininase
MTKKTQGVITRRPSVRLHEGALTYVERLPLDFELALVQHAAYRAAMGVPGGVVIDVPAADDFPDSTFVEDVLLAFPECFVLCRPGAASRAGEPALMAPWLPGDRPTFAIPSPATVDGGDVLQIGKDVFVGLSKRTNADGLSALGHILAPFGYAVRPVAVRGALHLKTAITAPADQFVLANPDWVDLEPFIARRVIAVHPEELFAANTLRIGDDLFMQSAHTLTADRLRAFGLAVAKLDISEFAKLEAGLTCMSVVVPRASAKGS